VTAALQIVCSPQWKVVLHNLLSPAMLTAVWQQLGPAMKMAVLLMMMRRMGCSVQAQGRKISMSGAAWSWGQR
jgi:hypothetical protein